jgi:HK97 family phage major capsid protein
MELKEELEGLKSEIKSHVDTKTAEAVKGANEKTESLEVELKASKEELQKQFDALSTKVNKNQGPEKVKSFSETLYENLREKAAELSGLKASRKEGISFDVKAAGTMLISGNYSGGTVGLSTFDNEFARVQRRQPFLRELVTVRPVSSSYVAWAEQANPDGGAGNTAEGAAKTQADFDIVEANKKVEKITAYMKVSKEALSDIAFLQSEINTELVELVNLKLDGDLLSGSGTSPVIKGIETYTTTLSVAGSPLALGVDNANNFDVLRAAAWKIAANNFVPNYAIVNPVDAAMMDLAKGTDGHYIMPPFSTADGKRVAGLTIVENNGVTAGSFLVGDFRKSNLGIREDINISIGYENDDFTKNLVTILAEVRAVHYIKSNHVGAFTKGVFATVKAALETA